VGSDILLLRSIARPWAIVRRSPSNKVGTTKETNDRSSLGDRSLSRHVPEGVRAPPSHARTKARVRSFARYGVIEHTQGSVSRD
jgi:hypothetical protein